MTNEDFMDMYDDYLMHANSIARRYTDAPQYKGNEKAYNRWYYENVTKKRAKPAASRQALNAQAALWTSQGRANVRERNMRRNEAMSEAYRKSPRQQTEYRNSFATQAQSDAARRANRRARTEGSAANVSNEERRSRYKTNMRKRKFTAGINRIKSRGNKIAKQLKNQWNAHLDNYNIGMDELSNMIKRAKTDRKKKKVRKMAGF